MTKEEAIAKIENIEGMGGSRCVALVDALDALGLLNLGVNLAKPVIVDTDYANIKAKLHDIIADPPATFREIKVGVTEK